MSFSQCVFIDAWTNYMFLKRKSDIIFSEFAYKHVQFQCKQETQNWQEYGFSPLQVYIYHTKFDLNENKEPHTLHIYGFSPVLTSLWLLKDDIKENLKAIYFHQEYNFTIVHVLLSTTVIPAEKKKLNYYKNTVSLQFVLTYIFSSLSSPKRYTLYKDMVFLKVRVYIRPNMAFM